MLEKLLEFQRKRDEYELNFFRNRICSVKQFVGNGKIDIDTETTNFNSTSVEVIITRSDGETFTLGCDYAISNGIKMGKIDVDFLLYEKLDNSIPNYDTNCCIFYKDEKYSISLDINNDYCPLDFEPCEERDDQRFFNRNFKILCSIKDYISEDGNFYQNKIDKREFVITRYQNDQNHVRLLCSQEIKFQLSNGKNPKDLLDYYIGIYVNEIGEEFLRIFDKKDIKTETWYRHTGTLFIIDQVMKNPYKYSFIDVSFNKTNYLKIK